MSIKTLFTTVLGAIFLYKAYQKYKEKKEKNDKYKKEAFLIHRDIDPDCQGKPLSVGIFMDNESRTRNKQGIRWGDWGDDIKELVSFSNESNKLIYQFKDNNELIIYNDNNDNNHNNDDKKLMYSFKSPEIGEVVKEIDKHHFSTIKTISMGEISRDLDQLMTFSKHFYRYSEIK
jgi:hypothetical protein